MKTMNKFWKYFINFVVLFLLVSGLMYLGNLSAKQELKQKEIIKCAVQTTSPVISIIECKDGMLKGTVENNTSILINVIYVKAEFYDKNNNLLETKYSEIKYFNVGEKSKFEIEFTSEDVTNIKVTTVETNV